MNYKIRVANEAESKEVQELLFELGYKWIGIGAVYYKISLSFNYITAYCKGKTLAQGRGLDAKKEITIPQLKDMVVLKRNDPKDENVYQDGDVPCLYNLYLTSDKNLYFFFCGKGWKLSAINDDDDYRKLLKPITKEPTMKEYLNKLEDGTYKLVLLDSIADGVDGLIEVPEGADTLAGDERTHYFWKHGVGEKGNMIIGVGESLSRYPKWDDCEDSADEWLGQINCEHSRILWQRETLNDKVASAEVARQEFIGVPFSDLPEFNFGAIEVADVVDVVDESNVEQTLSDRESTYGSFRDVAELTSSLMNDLLRLDMSFVQREALHMICSKLARIANGDPNHIDSWHDIAGYATLVVKDINGDS